MCYTAATGSVCSQTRVPEIKKTSVTHPYLTMLPMRVNITNITQPQLDLGPEMETPELQPLVFHCKLRGSASEYPMAAPHPPIPRKHFQPSQLGGAVTIYLFISWVEPRNASKHPTVRTGHVGNRLIPSQMPTTIE